MVDTVHILVDSVHEVTREAPLAAAIREIAARHGVAATASAHR
jgi:hypothetical protein